MVLVETSRIIICNLDITRTFSIPLKLRGRMNTHRLTDVDSRSQMLQCWLVATQFMLKYSYWRPESSPLGPVQTQTT